VTRCCDDFMMEMVAKWRIALGFCIFEIVYYICMPKLLTLFYLPATPKLDEYVRSEQRLLPPSTKSSQKRISHTTQFL
jgi:hypothetical protein